jgi:type IV secretion system protein VirB3
MQAEAIYKGATRPAMKMGIPLVPLVAVVGSGLLLILWGGTLISWWLAVAIVVAYGPLLVWMRWVTHLDDQRLRQMFLAAKLRRHNHNRNLWRSRSYCPHLLHGASDAWHV